MLSSMLDALGSGRGGALPQIAGEPGIGIDDDLM